jgi:hypothetical protein
MGVNTIGTAIEAYAQTFDLYLDWRPPVTHAYVQTYGQIPSGCGLTFKPEQWAPFATINGFSVRTSGDVFVYPCSLLLDANKNFLGLQVRVNLIGSQTILTYLGFQVTMLGKIILSASGPF